MSMQKKSKQIPSDVINLVREIIQQEITSIEFKGNFHKYDDEVYYDISVFIINESYLVSLYDNCTKFYRYQTIDYYEDEKKQFGESVRNLMIEGDIPWEIGKLIIRQTSGDDEKTEDICRSLQDAKEMVNNKSFWSKLVDEKGERSALNWVLNHHKLQNVFNIHRKKTFNLLKSYLFAN